MRKQGTSSEAWLMAPLLNHTFKSAEIDKNGLPLLPSRISFFPLNPPLPSLWRERSNWLEQELFQVRFEK